MGDSSHATAASPSPFAGLQIEREILIEGIARGVERAMAGGVREEVRGFLEDYFGVLDKSEVAAFLGVSERTVEQLWKDQVLPKDTALGHSMPRGWLPALKEVLSKFRIKARETSAIPRALKKAA